MKQLTAIIYILFFFLSCLFSAEASEREKPTAQNAKNAYSSIDKEAAIKEIYRIRRNPAVCDSVMDILNFIVDDYISNGSPANEKALYMDALANLGYINLYYHHNHSIAYLYLRQAQDIAKELDDSETFIRTSNDLAFLSQVDSYISQNHVHQMKSLQTQIDIFDAYRKLGDTDMMTIVFFNMCSLVYHSGITFDLSKYADILKNESGSERESPYADITFKFFNAIVLKENGQTEKAMEELYVMDSITAADPEKYMRVRFATTANLAHAEYENKNFRLSLRHLDKALDLTDHDFMYEAKSLIYRDMANNHLALGDTSRSDHFMNLFYSRRDSIYYSNGSHRLDDYESIYQQTVLTRRMMEMYADRKVKNIIISCASLLIVAGIGFAFYFSRNYRRMKADNRKMYELTQRAERERSISRSIEYGLVKSIDTPSESPQAQSGAYNLQQQSPEENMPPETQTTPSSQPPTDHAPEPGMERLALKIRDFMDSSDKIYCETFGLKELAETLDEKPRTVSRAIGEVLRTNLSSLLTEHRIREACRRLSTDSEYTNYTIEAIAMGVGYKSRTAFINAFQKQTGLKPSEYRKLAAENPADSQSSDT